MDDMGKNQSLKNVYEKKWRRTKMKPNSLRKILAAVALSMSVSILTPEVESLGVGTVSVEAASVKLNATKKTLAVGKKFNLKLKNVSKKAKITWKTSSKKIASVKSNGSVCVVTGKKRGIATITAKVKLNGKTSSYKCKVTVNSAPALSEKTKTMGKKRSFILTLSNAEKEAKWSVSNKNILTLKRVAKNRYKVVSKKLGTANVMAVYEGKKYVCRVDVVENATVVESGSSKEEGNVGGKGNSGNNGNSGLTDKGSNSQESTEKETETDYYFSLSIDNDTIFIGDTAKITVKTNSPDYYLYVKYPDKNVSSRYGLNYNEQGKYTPPKKISPDETMHLFQMEGKITVEIILSYLGEVKDTLKVTVTDIYKKVDGVYTLGSGWRNNLTIKNGELNSFRSSHDLFFYANPSLSGKNIKWHCTGVNTEVLTYSSLRGEKGKIFGCMLIGVTAGTDTLTVSYNGETIATCNITVVDSGNTGRANIREARQVINRIVNECAQKLGIGKVDENLSRQERIDLLSEFCTYLTENYNYADRSDEKLQKYLKEFGDWGQHWMFVEGGSGHCGTSAEAVKYVAQNLLGLESRYSQFGANDSHLVALVEVVEGEYWVFNGTPNKNGKSYVAKPDGNGGWEVDYEIPMVGGKEEVYHASAEMWNAGW